MVAEPRTWVDGEAALRAWAREAMPALGGRVFFAYNDKAAQPQVVLQRIAGPDDRCLIQFDIWGATKAVAARTAARLATEADAIGRYTFEPEAADEPSVLIHGALVESVRWQPDEESGAARYVVEATFMLTAAE